MQHHISNSETWLVSACASFYFHGRVHALQLDCCHSREDRGGHPVTPSTLMLMETCVCRHHIYTCGISYPRSTLRVVLLPRYGCVPLDLSARNSRYLPKSATDSEVFVLADSPPPLVGGISRAFQPPASLFSHTGRVSDVYNFPSALAQRVFLVSCRCLPGHVRSLAIVPLHRFPYTIYIPFGALPNPASADNSLSFL